MVCNQNFDWTYQYFLQILNLLLEGVAYNGVDQIQVEGKEVLVIGCGAIGLFAIAVAKAKGSKIEYNYYGCLVNIK